MIQERNFISRRDLEISLEGTYRTYAQGYRCTSSRCKPTPFSLSVIDLDWAFGLLRYAIIQYGGL